MDTQPTSNRAKDLLLGTIAAFAGGVIGYFAFRWIARQGFYALMIPGALVGAGFGCFAEQRRLAPAIVCCFAAIGLGIFTEWRFAPFIKNDSFTYFLLHLHQLRPVTLLMILLGGFCGYWLALGWRQRP